MIPTNLIGSELLGIKFMSDTMGRSSRVTLDFGAGRLIITATGEVPLRLDFESQTKEGVEVEVVLGA